jgi:molecular chaperone DnaJ
MKDYYNVLGVNKEATSEEIDAAYRKLAMQYHPDTSRGDTADKFKEISEAHDVLGDSDKRSRYDRQALFRQRGSWSFEEQKNNRGRADVSDIFSQLFEQTAIRGTRVRMDVTLEEIFSGVAKSIDAPGSNRCGDCGGTGVSKWTVCKTCSGSGMVSSTQSNFVLRTTCQTCSGRCKTPVCRCEKCSGKGVLPGKGDQIEITIPPGAENGTQIRIPEKGIDGTDLYVVLNVKKHDLYERQGRNLYHKLPVTYTQLALGGKVEIETLGGKIEAKIRAGTQNGDRLRLKEQGLPAMQNPAIKGDLYLILEVVVPKAIDKQERELLKKLSVLEKKKKRHDIGGK